MLESLPFGVAVFDEKRELILLNELYASLLDFPAELLQKENVAFADILQYIFQRGDYPNQRCEEVLAEFMHMTELRQSFCFERNLASGVFLEMHGCSISSGWTLLTPIVTPPRRNRPSRRWSRRGAWLRRQPGRRAISWFT